MTNVERGGGISAPTHDEAAFTPWAEPGWLSWDPWSPEQDFCRFIATMQRMLRPEVVLETGVGVGRITGHLDLDGCTYLGFESNSSWRQPPADPDRDSPSPTDFAAADFVILDSDPPFRQAEIRAWAHHGKPGSVCVIHDAGNGHADSSFHGEVGRLIQEIGIPGVSLRNPRGGWMGWLP